MIDLTHNEYRKILARAVRGAASPWQLQAAMADLLDRLAMETGVKGISSDDRDWIEKLSGSMSFRPAWADIEAGLMAGTKQDFINEEEGNR